jgi:hypothetical protein
MWAGLSLGVVACGGDTTVERSDPSPPTTPTPSTPTPSTPAPTTAHVTTEPEPTTSSAASEAVSTTAARDDSWMADAAAMCAAYGAELPSDPADVAASIAFHRDLRNRLPWLETLDLPDELRAAPTDVAAVMREADDYLVTAEGAITAGDAAAGGLALQQYLSLLEHSAALVTVAGAECGDPSRAAKASLNVPVPTATQLGAGFGSVWVSQGPFFTNVVRVDTDTGDVEATIDLGVPGGKLQPADGRMIVRTTDAYFAIDPTTNAVVATLAKSDVGPAANRGWAVDGALWICDGQRLHRYDPATFTPSGIVIELGIECGQVYATDDLVVAWPYNEDAGESGTSAAAFIDPATNELLATLALPSDVTVPIVLDDAVFFPADLGTVNAVVDRGTWALTSRPDYGRVIVGSQMASDGESIYLIADRKDVLVVDAETYEQTDVIEPLTVVSGANSLAVTPGALWVATNDVGILQRFDIPT